jgi:RNA polymerase sigma factor (TIGR02999 family)
VTSPGEVTQWLARLHDGDDSALEHLMGLLYDELRAMARQQLRRERPGHTLNPTALVNEVYLKLIQQRRIHASYRTQFMAIASHSMRRILVDYARTKKRLKRGAGEQPVPIEDVAEFLADREADEVLALDDALERLASINQRAAEVVNYRFYSGLTMEETADMLQVSVKTVQRDWLTARAWLRKEVAQDLGPADPA